MIQMIPGVPTCIRRVYSWVFDFGEDAAVRINALGHIIITIIKPTKYF